MSEQPTTPGLGALAAALAKAQAEFGPVIKDHVARITSKTGASYTYKYAAFDSVLAAILPSLTKNGLALIQSVAVDGNRVSITTDVLHLSGERVSFGEVVMLAEDAKPQSLGSAITYARRYGASALGVAPEEDDGAQEAQRPRVPNGIAKRQETMQDRLADVKSRLQKPQERATLPAEPPPIVKTTQGSQKPPAPAVADPGRFPDGSAKHPMDDEPPLQDPDTGEYLGGTPSELGPVDVERTITRIMAQLHRVARTRAKVSDAMKQVFGVVALVHEMSNDDYLIGLLRGCSASTLTDGLVVLEGMKP